MFDGKYIHTYAHECMHQILDVLYIIWFSKVFLLSMDTLYFISFIFFYSFFSCVARFGFKYFAHLWQTSTIAKYTQIYREKGRNGEYKAKWKVSQMEKRVHTKPFPYTRNVPLARVDWNVLHPFALVIFHKRYPLLLVCDCPVSFVVHRYTYSYRYRTVWKLYRWV